MAVWLGWTVAVAKSWNLKKLQQLRMKCTTWSHFFKWEVITSWYFS